MAEMLLSDLAYYTARPTLRIDGQDSELAAQCLQAMQMREHEGGLSSLELGFVNFATGSDGRPRLAFEDEQLIELGSEIKVYAGEAAAPTEIFRGRVSALEFAFDSEGAPRQRKARGGVS